jgi:hypothetical protein
MKTEDEIFSVLDAIHDNTNDFKKSSYEDGVQAALDWVLGRREENPLED